MSSELREFGLIEMLMESDVKCGVAGSATASATA